MPAARHFWYLQYWQFFLVTRLTSHAARPFVHLKVSLYLRTHRELVILSVSFLNG